MKVVGDVGLADDGEDRNRIFVPYGIVERTAIQQVELGLNAV